MFPTRHMQNTTIDDVCSRTVSTNHIFSDIHTRFHKSHLLLEGCFWWWGILCGRTLQRLFFPFDIQILPAPSTAAFRPAAPHISDSDAPLYCFTFSRLSSYCERTAKKRGANLLYRALQGTRYGNRERLAASHVKSQSH